MAERRARRPPVAIEDHALIGDMSTAALVSREGAIDFLCWPRFDSPTVFASLLDPEKGGEFVIRPVLRGARTMQIYLPDTNVALTRWLAEDGSAEVTDVMRPQRGVDGGEPHILRRVEATRGEVRFEASCSPRFDYARSRGVARKKGDSVIFKSRHADLRLTSDAPLRARRGGDATASFTLKKGEVAWFVLDGGEGDAPLGEAAEVALASAVAWWRRWAGQSTYKGRWRETVMRSALALKLMTTRDHGSIVAAPTFGLPEAPGGERNWDYRATWIRDASFTVYALVRLGFHDEAVDFMAWIAKRLEENDGRLSIMYGPTGGRELEEIELDHLAGYGGARPVRIGNKAVDQIQLDIYGELLDAAYLADKYGRAMSADGWRATCKIVEHVCDHWKSADAGIWEIRCEPREFLHSRLMCWVAVDRALRLASKRSLPAPIARWTACRDEIHKDIWTNFWDEELGHFVESRGSKDLDGAMLLMPLVRFLGARDPKWLATLDAIGHKLSDDALVFRYRGEDGLKGREGAFTACSFWYVECLARAERLDEARTAFEKILGYANHVGLFAEEIGLDGGHLGNFPQALTHLALISAAFFLDRELSGERGTWRP
ncbi:glycoside hydrolase family 15 protein [Hansschlegelia quercus]|uniref:Glycoside hydrolase family 15 protein n=1 Tax=Hansschlegelia quercus TaxID=2528245 RepID=A0A4Q9GKY8_9HYPH|nr:glycoside hydrolase family 15 protein [Hansschlegelia quercus]TBN53725.1 glycoside hydrolase family 15 protein [Hansschlegelia quercus]